MISMLINLYYTRKSLKNREMDGEALLRLKYTVRG